MSVSAVIQSICTVTEVLERNADSMDTAGATIIHNQFNESMTLTSATATPVTETAQFIQALSGGAATIDLTALNGADDTALDLTGLKVQYFRLKNLGANTMTVTFAAANPYELGGSTGVWIVQPSGWIDFYANDNAPDVASGAKNITLAGTVSQTCEITIVAG